MKTNRKRRKPRLLKSKILNPPKTKVEQEEFSRSSCKALAIAINENFEPEQIDKLIEVLREGER